MPFSAGRGQNLKLRHYRWGEDGVKGGLDLALYLYH